MKTVNVDDHTAVSNLHEDDGILHNICNAMVQIEGENEDEDSHRTRQHNKLIVREQNTQPHQQIP